MMAIDTTEIHLTQPVAQHSERACMECNEPIITVEISESDKWSNAETNGEAHNMEKNQ